MRLIKLIINNTSYILSNFFFILNYNFKNSRYFSPNLNLAITFFYHYLKKIFILNNKFSDQKKNFKSLVKNKEFSNDWFTENITIWLYIFTFMHSNKNIECLEIGSYEGMSAMFCLKNLENSKIDCIETFQGADEHYRVDFKKVKKNFEYNLNEFKQNYNLYQMTSDDFFYKFIQQKSYDLIYIDGSHHSDQVYKDAINSFKHLKKGGILIFDDFLRKYYKDINQNPINAILKFINEKKNEINIIYVSYQLAIKKNN